MHRKLARLPFSILFAPLLAAALMAALAGPRFASADPAAGQPLRVGAATANFAADDKMQIAGGIDPQYYQGQEGELRAVATVIGQPGSGKFAIVACDVIAVTRAMIDAAAVRIEKSCGIEPAHLLVNATPIMPPAPPTRMASRPSPSLFAPSRTESCGRSKRPTPASKTTATLPSTWAKNPTSVRTAACCWPTT
jgi:hypothetical protein